MLTKRLAALGLAAAVTLPLGAACSKSNETSTSSNNVVSSTTTTKSGSGGGSSGGGASSGGANSQADCIAAASAYAKVAMQASQIMAPGQKFDASQFDQELSQVKGSVPADLKADLDTWAAGYSKFLESLQGVDFSNVGALTNGDTLQKLQDANAALETDEFKKADANIKAYFDKCN